MKLIISKYATRCGACKKVITAGSRCYWAKGVRPLCESCKAKNAQSVPSIAPAVPAAKGKKNPYSPDFTIDWAELRPIIQQATSRFGGKVPKPEGWKSEQNWRT